MMEELGNRRSRLIRKPQLEDVPEELMHLIQSYLTPKEAARTSILSKSWLHAWSTIPTLWFRQQVTSAVCPTQRASQLMMVDRTLQRYLRDNIPFETIDLLIPINDQVSDSLAEKWIRPVATRTCVKELSLTVKGDVEAPYTLPGEIFSSENIRKISIQTRIDHNLCIGSNPMINCVSLRVLDLGRVRISEEVLDSLLSTCSLLEEVKLACCKGLKTIKVKNLRYLCKLMILTLGDIVYLEIYDVPNLSRFEFYTFNQKYLDSFTIDSLGSVKEISLKWVFIDKAVLDTINCMCLRVLDLEYVIISEEALDNLLSTCRLLEEVKLSRCQGLKTIKVKNLRYLFKLMIETDKSVNNLEIYGVPNLSCFKCYSFSQKYCHSFIKDSFESVIELSLGGRVIIDEAFLDMIKLKFRLLQNLTLEITNWSSESFDITCLSLKRLSLSFRLSPILIKVQVFAPILSSFNYDGKTMPGLVFPAITPEQIKVKLDMDHPIDGLFFVKMRETLMLSSNFNIYIRVKFDVAVALNIDFDDLRKRFPFPATNLQHLSVQTSPRNRLPEYSPFFDAFFSICHPKYVTASIDCFEGNNYMCKLMIKEVMEKNTSKGSWPHYLQGVETKNPHNGNWEMLTDSWKSLVEPARDKVEFKLKARYKVEFKLNWCSS